MYKHAHIVENIRLPEVRYLSHVAILNLSEPFYSAIENLTISDCGSVINNSLTSPGYPNSYPRNMDCNYSVLIPRGMAMNIQFHDFDLEVEPKFPLCR